MSLCSPSELSKEVQVSLNFTNTASWSTKGPGVNFINSDGEERKPILVNTYISSILIQATELKGDENSLGKRESEAVQYFSRGMVNNFAVTSHEYI